ncbi:hypothetical protein JTB14_029964 [Gonioctena quinquepunctata]|nr:hypothetical protein JTB14_029964 [Gonioctena quinquepunctata]
MDEDIAQIPQLRPTFKKSMMADFRHARMNHQEATIALLDHIKDIVSRCRPGVNLSDLGIEYDPLGIDDAQMNSDEETDADLHENNFEENHVPPTEYLIYDDLGDDVTTDQITDKTRENLFYIDGPGGTGKTYLYNTLITVLNDILRLKTVAMAWTGIAANLLKGGTTVHRSFRLPLTLSEDTTCGFTMQSTQTKNIRDKVALIIWDEAPMTPRFAMGAVNRYLIDIKRRIEPMGGKCVLFGGNFRQILPVVLGGRRFDIIAQSLKASELWHSFTRLQLTENMRVALHPEMTVPHDDLDKCTFGQWLLKLGEGMIPFIKLNQRAAPVAPDDLIEIPMRFQVSTVDELIDFVYEEDYTAIENGSRAILCPTNAVVNEINTLIIRQIET